MRKSKWRIRSKLPPPLTLSFIKNRNAGCEDIKPPQPAFYLGFPR